MTAEPGPGLIGPEAERLREDFHRDRQEREAAPEPLTAEADEPEAGHDEPTTELDGFDPVAAAREHWDAPSRTVYPDLIPSRDVIALALSGGDADAEAMDRLRQRAKRAGWSYSIDPRTGARLPRR